MLVRLWLAAFGRKASLARDPLPLGTRCSQVPHSLALFLLLWPFCGHQGGSPQSHRAQVAESVSWSLGLTQRCPRPRQSVTECASLCSWSKSS